MARMKVSTLPKGGRVYRRPLGHPLRRDRRIGLDLRKRRALGLQHAGSGEEIALRASPRTAGTEKMPPGRKS